MTRDSELVGCAARRRRPQVPRPVGVDAIVERYPAADGAILDGVIPDEIGTRGGRLPGDEQGAVYVLHDADVDRRIWTRS